MPNPIVVERKTLYPDGRVGVRHCYWCPGCDLLHCIPIDKQGRGDRFGWTYHGTLERPSYWPSQLTTWDGPWGQTVCHTYISEGRIQFLSDTTHILSGHTVDLPPLPDWIVRETAG